jgi:hypothetical protein
MIDHNKGRFNPSKYLKAKATAIRPMLILIMRDRDDVVASDGIVTRTMMPAIIFICDVTRAKHTRLDVIIAMFLNLISIVSRSVNQELKTVIAPIAINATLT